MRIDPKRSVSAATHQLIRRPDRPIRRSPLLDTVSPAELGMASQARVVSGGGVIPQRTRRPFARRHVEPAYAAEDFAAAEHLAVAEDFAVVEVSVTSSAEPAGPGRAVGSQVAQGCGPTLA